MNELNELQDIWKSGKNENKEFPKQPLPGKLLEKLKKLESFQDRVNKIKLGFGIFAILELIYVLYHFNITSFVAYAGLGIVTAGLAVFMLYYFKNQFNIKKLDFTKSSAGFIDSAIEMLEKQNAIFKVPFLLFSASLLVGFNVLVYGLKAPEHNFKINILFTLLILVSTFIGYRVRMWRTKREVLPVIKELKEMKENLNA